MTTESEKLLNNEGQSKQHLEEIKNRADKIESVLLNLLISSGVLGVVTTMGGAFYILEEIEAGRMEKDYIFYLILFSSSFVVPTGLAYGAFNELKSYLLNGNLSFTNKKSKE